MFFFCDTSKPFCTTFNLKRNDRLGCHFQYIYIRLLLRERERNNDDDDDDETYNTMVSADLVEKKQHFIVLRRDIEKNKGTRVKCFMCQIQLKYSPCSVFFKWSKDNGFYFIIFFCTLQSKPND